VWKYECDIIGAFVWKSDWIDTVTFRWRFARLRLTQKEQWPEYVRLCQHWLEETRSFWSQAKYISKGRQAAYNSQTCVITWDTPEQDTRSGAICWQSKTVLNVQSRTWILKTCVVLTCRSIDSEPHTVEQTCGARFTNQWQNAACRRTDGRQSRMVSGTTRMTPPLKRDSTDSFNAQRNRLKVAFRARNQKLDGTILLWKDRTDDWVRIGYRTSVTQAVRWPATNVWATKWDDYGFMMAATS
jgi:hypothetical protein